MLNIFTRPLRKLLNVFGYEIIKKENEMFASRVGSWLDKMNINTIIDVGANEGQFIQSITRSLPGRKIYAFEPIKACYDKLVENTKHLNVTTYNIGLSDHNGSSEINISENFVSSSILPIENLTTSLYPDSKYINKQTITLKKLDDVIDGGTLSKNILLKIDVQGYEEMVIAGGTETLKNIAIVFIEFSYQPLYEGQWLFDETYKYFTSIGFNFVGVADQINSGTTGIPLYGDAIFIRKELVNQVY